MKTHTEPKSGTLQRSNASPLQRFNSVTLHDGRAGLRGGIAVDIGEPTVEQLSRDGVDRVATGEPGAILDFIASDETLDRYEEIICAGGWRLDNYQRNPVFQNAHKYGDIIFTLGRALVTEVRAVAGRQVLFQRVEFATAHNPMAKIAYGLYKGKFLNAVSVGFIPLRWENADGSEQGNSQGCGLPLPAPSEEGEAHRHATRSSLFALRSSPSSPSGRFRRRYLEQELLEVSAVGIPANPNALVLGLKAGALETSDLRALAELLGHLLREPQPSASNHQPAVTHHASRITNHAEQPPSTPNHQPITAATDANTGALGASGYEAQWLQLARALREVLKRA